MMTSCVGPCPAHCGAVQQGVRGFWPSAEAWTPPPRTRIPPPQLHACARTRRLPSEPQCTSLTVPIRNSRRSCLVTAVSCAHVPNSCRGHCAVPLRCPRRLQYPERDRSCQRCTTPACASAFPRGRHWHCTLYPWPGECNAVIYRRHQRHLVHRFQIKREKVLFYCDN